MLEPREEEEEEAVAVAAANSAHAPPVRRQERLPARHNDGKTDRRWTTTTTDAAAIPFYVSLLLLLLLLFIGQQQQHAQVVLSPRLVLVSSSSRQRRDDADHRQKSDTTTIFFKNASSSSSQHDDLRQRRRRRPRRHRRLKGVQPKMTIIEKNPARKAFGSLSNAEGTPWCLGRPTYWIVGHQKWNETPWCQGERGEWTQPMIAVLDVVDEQNSQGKEKFIDRHDCTTLDINGDGIGDIICIVGASKGTGFGYNEVYLTASDGTLTKIQTGHGLHRFPTMRGRRVVTLYAKQGRDPQAKAFVFIATKGTKRPDGEPNQHRMFRLKSGDKLPYFKHVNGPWIQHFEAACAVAADFNGDDRDDLIVCNENGDPLIVRQASGGFKKVHLPKLDVTTLWRNVRVADLNGDKVPDLAVVYMGQPSHLRVFLGRRQAPWFDFRAPYYEHQLPHAAPDLEIVNVNGDKLPDIYVVQSDEVTKHSYCAAHKPNRFWGNTVQPKASWVPPLDRALDFVFVGIRGAPNQPKYVKNVIGKQGRGCGYLVEKFGNDSTMLLADGAQSHAGEMLLLDWN